MSRVQIDFHIKDDPRCVSVTQQSGKDECDINKIVKRAEKTGMIPFINGNPLFGDFTNAADFQGMFERVTVAQERFMQLPGELRAKFHHNVGNLIDFVNDEKNGDEARKLGLLPPLTLEQNAKRAADAKAAADAAAAAAAGTH